MPAPPTTRQRPSPPGRLTRRPRPQLDGDHVGRGPTETKPGDNNHGQFNPDALDFHPSSNSAVSGHRSGALETAPFVEMQRRACVRAWRGAERFFEFARVATDGGAVARCSSSVGHCRALRDRQSDESMSGSRNAGASKSRRWEIGQICRRRGEHREPVSARPQRQPLLRVARCTRARTRGAMWISVPPRRPMP